MGGGERIVSSPISPEGLVVIVSRARAGERGLGWTSLAAISGGGGGVDDTGKCKLCRFQ